MSEEAESRWPIPAASQSSNSRHEEHITELVAMGSRHNGFAPTRIHSAREALRKVDRGAGRLMILDVMIPDLDGFEVAAGCRQARGSRHLQCRSIFPPPPGTPPRKKVQGLKLESTTTSRNPFP